MEQRGVWQCYNWKEDGFELGGFLGFHGED